MGWPEVIRALHLLLPFARELLFGHRRLFHNLSKTQINALVASLGVGVITLVTVVVFTNAIHKESELNAEIRRLVPYEDVVIKLNKLYGVDLLGEDDDGLSALVVDPPHTRDYDTLWKAYEALMEENESLRDQCLHRSHKPPKHTKRPTPHKGDNARILKRLEGLW